MTDDVIESLRRWMVSKSYSATTIKYVINTVKKVMRAGLTCEQMADVNAADMYFEATGIPRLNAKSKTGIRYAMNMYRDYLTATGDSNGI